MAATDDEGEEAGAATPVTRIVSTGQALSKASQYPFSFYLVRKNATHPTPATAAANSVLCKGIIGSGLIGQEHIRNLKLLPGARVVAVADTNDGSLSAAKALLEGHGECLFTSTFEDVLKDPAVDAVLVATPNFHHIRVLRKAIAAGKSILCEKPLCISVAECAEILQLLEKSSQYALFDSDEIEAGCGALSLSSAAVGAGAGAGVGVGAGAGVGVGVASRVFWVGMEYRYYPSIARLIKEVHGGTCGKLHMLSIREQ